MSEGYIKFTCEQVYGMPVQPMGFDSLNLLRTRLWDLGLVGERGGIGFGNLSLRLGDLFLITGSKTGGKRIATIEDYALVLDWDESSFWIKSLGLKPASSESFTHLAVYRVRPRVKVVVHVHSHALWQWGKSRLSGTPEWAEFGSKELADELSRLMVELNQDWGVIGMWGHEDGLLFWGRSIGEVWRVLNSVIGQFGGGMYEV